MCKFTITFDREEDGRFIAEVQEIPGALAFGANRAEAKAKVKAIALRSLAEQIEHGRTILNCNKIIFQYSTEQNKRLASDRPILNSYASHLRDIADRDYIASRIMFRAILFENFHWTALQAIEKYLKSIILFNTLVDIRKYSHIISDLINVVKKKVGIAFHLTEEECNLLSRIESYGNGRYGDLCTSFYSSDLGDNHNNDLYTFDSIIYKIRKYCQNMTYRIKLPSGKTISISPKRSLKLCQISGHLEDVLAVKMPHYLFERDALVWNNPMLGGASDNQFNDTCVTISHTPPWTGNLVRENILKKYIRLTRR